MRLPLKKLWKLRDIGKWKVNKRKHCVAIYERIFNLKAKLGHRIFRDISLSIYLQNHYYNI